MTHGNTYNSSIIIPQAPPTVIYTKPNEKKLGVATSLWRVVPLGDRPSSPSGVGHWARACTCTCRWSVSLVVRTLASPTTRLLSNSVHNATPQQLQSFSTR